LFIIWAIFQYLQNYAQIQEFNKWGEPGCSGMIF
jgi:hypothetical protein